VIVVARYNTRRELKTDARNTRQKVTQRREYRVVKGGVRKVHWGESITEESWGKVVKKVVKKL